MQRPPTETADLQRRQLASASTGISGQPRQQLHLFGLEQALCRPIAAYFGNPVNIVERQGQARLSKIAESSHSARRASRS